MLVEGETEKYYIDALRKTERCHIRIKPRIVHQIGLGDIEEYIREYVEEGYDRIFWIVDMDTYRNKESEFYEVCQRIANEAEILINCPCFEVWLLLHFDEAYREFSDCKAVINELKTHGPMANYEKTERFYLRNNVYQKLKPYLDSAIRRAKKLDKAKIKTKAQIYRLVEEVLKISS